VIGIIIKINEGLLSCNYSPSKAVHAPGSGQLSSWELVHWLNSVCLQSDIDTQIFMAFRNSLTS